MLKFIMEYDVGEMVSAVVLAISEITRWISVFCSEIVCVLLAWTLDLKKPAGKTCMVSSQKMCVPISISENFTNSKTLDAVWHVLHLVALLKNLTKTFTAFPTSISLSYLFEFSFSDPIECQI